MKTCPFFGVCGGCKYDFTAADYREQKLSELAALPVTNAPVWTDAGTRRRADFAFSGGMFGFYQHRSKNIVPVRHCPLLRNEINELIPSLAKLPWGGMGSCLVTICDNGIDVSINSTVPYFSSEFKSGAEKLPNVIRVTWNERTVFQRAVPVINFDGHIVEYPAGAFLQPTIPSENTLREMVINAANGASHVADLFCGLGNFTFALNADGFDIAGIGIKRDLFSHPLTVGMLTKYDCVVMDPPRAGAFAQCRELINSNVPRIIYVSCNPQTWQRDANILTNGGYKINNLTPVDQFIGSAHWELFSVFEK